MKLFKLTRALVVVVNKNDDSRYYERLKANNSHANMMLKIGEKIIKSELPPGKIGNQTWYKCKWCNFKDICHFNYPVDKNCRTCVYCDLINDGKWSCSKRNDKVIPLEVQRIGCKKYLILPSLKQ